MRQIQIACVVLCVISNVGLLGQAGAAQAGKLYWTVNDTGKVYSAYTD